jgi:hypothetical protein
MSHDGDLEAQRDLLQPHRASYLIPLGWKVLMALGKGSGEGEIHEMTILSSETSSDANRASAVLPQPPVSQSIGAAFISPLPLHPKCDIPMLIL